MPTEEHTAKIRQLNDLCRAAPGIGGKWFVTHGIAALPAATQSAIREAVETHDQWPDDDDPWHEHDFGSVTVQGYQCYFKIDYYDPEYQYHSADPVDARVTRRVLTIMLADEY